MAVPGGCAWCLALAWCLYAVHATPHKPGQKWVTGKHAGKGKGAGGHVGGGEGFVDVRSSLSQAAEMDTKKLGWGKHWERGELVAKNVISRSKPHELVSGDGKYWSDGPAGEQEEEKLSDAFKEMQKGLKPLSYKDKLELEKLAHKEEKEKEKAKKDAKKGKAKKDGEKKLGVPAEEWKPPTKYEPVKGRLSAVEGGNVNVLADGSAVGAEHARPYVPEITVQNEHLPTQWEAWFGALRHFNGDKKDETFPFLDRKFGFIYCPVPKNACTQWKRLLFAIHGHRVPWNQMNIDPFADSARKRGLVRMEEPDVTPADAAKAMVDDRLYKFMVVRNPVVRLLSAYLYMKGNPMTVMRRRRLLKSSGKKKVGGKKGRHPGPPSAEDFESFVTEDVLPHVEKNCGWLRDNMNQHIRPQRCFCGMELAKEGVPMPYNYVGKFEEMKNVIDSVRKNLTYGPEEAWTTGYGQGGKKSFRDSFDLKSHTKAHAHDADKHWAEFYSPLLLEKVSVAFRGEIKAFGYEAAVVSMQKEVQKKNWDTPNLSLYGEKGGPPPRKVDPRIGNEDGNRP